MCQMPHTVAVASLAQMHAASAARSAFEEAARINARAAAYRAAGGAPKPRTAAASRLSDFPALVAVAEQLGRERADAKGAEQDVEDRIAAALARAEELASDDFGGGVRIPKP